MKLGEILLELGWLAPEQLNLVIANRDGPAARLGTQLVEKGLLTTDQVSEALSRQLRLPAALQRHFDKADARVVSLLKPELAARFMAIPLVATRSGITGIVVAMATPQDVQLLDNLSFALGARVEPMVAAELAIARNLKRLCNLEVKPPMTLAPDQRPLYLPRANAQASALAPGVPWPRHSTRPMGVPALGVATILPPAQRDRDPRGCPAPALGRFQPRPGGRHRHRLHAAQVRLRPDLPRARRKRPGMARLRPRRRGACYRDHRLSFVGAVGFPCHPAAASYLPWRAAA